MREISPSSPSRYLRNPRRVARRSTSCSCIGRPIYACTCLSSSQPRLVKKHADQLARAVLAELRWCPAHLRAEHDARVATAAASCWGRGVAVAPDPTCVS